MALAVVSAWLAGCDSGSGVDDDSAYDDDQGGGCPDADNDGYQDMACGGADCNDSDPSIHPGADEGCNGLDNDCSGLPAEAEVDFDGDGFWECLGDCDPLDPSVHPGAIEICGDGLDSDCDGTADNPDDPDVELPGFILGASSANVSEIPYLLDLGIYWVRPSLSWRSIEPEIQERELTIDQVRADPQMIEDYSLARNWSGYDGILSAFVQAGISPFPVIGHGYGSAHPLFQGERASPDALGKENYLGHQYLATRATVERYDGDGYLDNPYGITVKFWQTENELNQAYLTSLWGWREPAGVETLFNAWSDWDFLTDLLAALQLAVKDADPEALTTMNFHTDVHDDLNRLLRIPTWEESIAQWRDLVDIVGIDAYPNYYLPEPVRGEAVGERVELAYEAGCGKPVIVMECGYPNGPEVRGYDRDLQAQFIEEAFHAAYDAGVVGYFSWGMEYNGRLSVEITQEDLDALDVLGRAFDEGDVLTLLIYSLTHVEYVTGHFLDVVKTVEAFWGVVDSEQGPFPAYETLREIAQEVGEETKAGASP